MPEAPPLKEPLFWDYALGRVVLPEERGEVRVAGQRRRPNGKQDRIRRRELAKLGVQAKKPKVACRSCGAMCSWGRTRNGKWRLKSGGQWHWRSCPSAAAFRAALDAQRDLVSQGKGAILRDQ